MKKILSSIMAIIMLVSLIPVTFADNAVVYSQIRYYDQNYDITTDVSKAKSLDATATISASSGYDNAKFIMAGYSDLDCKNLVTVRMTDFTSAGNYYSASGIGKIFFADLGVTTIKEFFVSDTSMKPISASKTTYLGGEEPTPEPEYKTMKIILISGWDYPDAVVKIKPNAGGEEYTSVTYSVSCTSPEALIKYDPSANPWNLDFSIESALYPNQLAIVGAYDDESKITGQAIRLYLKGETPPVVVYPTPTPSCSPTPTPVATPTPTQAPSATPAPTASGSATLVSPADNETIDLHTEHQNTFLALDRSEWTEADANAHYEPTNSLPESITFSWTTSSSSSTIQIAEDANFTQGVISKQTTGNSIQLTNFKTGTKYYWRVNQSGVRTFTTKEGTRFIYIKGITNVRDIGGYTTSSGKKVVQGLVYRGKAFDSNGASSTVSDSTIQSVVIGDLGIKTDMELRSGPNVSGGVLTPYGCALKIYPISAYEDFLTSNQAYIKDMFENVFANRDAMPLYMHCKGGADRTGCVCVLLEAYLGVSEQNIYDDYELTLLGLGCVWRNSDKFKGFWTKLNSYSGTTLKDKATTYLKSECGITDATLNTITDIFLK